MGRAQGQDTTSPVTARGADGLLYRRGRRRRRYDVMIIPADIDERLRSLVEQLYSEEDAVRLLASHKIALSVDEFRELLAAGERKLLGYIPEEASWQLSLKEAAANCSVHLLGKGALKLDSLRPARDAGVHVRGSLDVAFLSGQLAAWDTCQVVQSGAQSALTIHDRCYASVQGPSCYCAVYDKATADLTRARRLRAYGDSTISFSSEGASGYVVLSGNAIAGNVHEQFDVAKLKSGGHGSGTPLEFGNVDLWWENPTRDTESFFSS